MNQPKKSFLLAAFFIFCSGLTAAFAQTPPAAKPSEPSFDVILQTVVASNEVGKTDVVPSLSAVIKKLKTDFSFSSYRLASTSIHRISNKSGASSRSVSYVTEKNLAVFSETQIESLESSIDDKGQDLIQIRRFNVSQRVPIISSSGAVNYEQLGLAVSFGLAKNTPTVVGSLATSKPNELMFLILTVRSAEK